MLILFLIETKDRTDMIKEQVITNRGGVFDAENIITGG